MINNILQNKYFAVIILHVYRLTLIYHIPVKDVNKIVRIDQYNQKIIRKINFRIQSIHSRQCPKVRRFIFYYFSLITAVSF